jgi:Skp family chaperone for outer membrane proteins
VGLVDVQKVFESSGRGKLQIASFQETLSKRQAEVRRLSEQVEAMRQEITTLARQGQNRSANHQLPAFEQARKQLVEAQQAANQELQSAQADVDKAFMQQLKIIADRVRKDEHLDIIQAYDASKILSFDATLDVTQVVLSRYNDIFPADSPEPFPKGDAPKGDFSHLPKDKHE